MTQGVDNRAPPGPSGIRYHVLFALAHLVLLWEQMWSRFWPLVCLAGLFVAVALLDVLPHLPALAHGLILLLFAACFLWALYHGVSGHFSLHKKDIHRRLEKDSELPHRPLEVLEDSPVGNVGQPHLTSLWQAHVLQASVNLSALKLKFPRPVVAALDPYAFRVGVVLLLVIGLTAGGDQFTERLFKAMVPGQASAEAKGMSADVWITPPGYTRMPPLFLDATKTMETVEIPQGSKILAQVSGVDSPPELEVGEFTSQFKSLGSSEDIQSWKSDVQLNDEATQVTALSIKVAGEEARRWPAQVIPDLPPESAFSKLTTVTDRQYLKVSFQANDDYGVEKIFLVIKPPKEVIGIGSAQPIRQSLPANGAADIKAVRTRNLTAHPWAGLKVDAYLEAVDAREQIGVSEEQSFILPERKFQHPVARQIIAIRKTLNQHKQIVISKAIQSLLEIMQRPQLFAGDTVVFLTLSVARNRLAYRKPTEPNDSVMTLLWEVALRLEDQGLSLAEQQLERLQEDLSDQLEGGANAEEIEALLDEYKQALDNYLRSLAQQLAKQGFSEMPFNHSAESMGRNQLQDMIDQARELMRTGAKESAREVMQRLRSMIDRLRNSARNAKAQAQSQAQMKAARQLLDQLRNLTARQQKMLDKTFQQSGKHADQGKPSQGDPTDNPQSETKDLASGQEKLRRELGEMMMKAEDLLGKIPGGLGKAERFMNQASKSLSKDDAGGAVPSQTSAIEQLQETLGSMSEQMARQSGQGMSLGFGPRQGRGQGRQQGQQPGPPQGFDPFGRPEGGGTGKTSAGGIEIPEISESRKARKLLYELRRRSGETVRPKLERDYIERLLKQF